MSLNSIEWYELVITRTLESRDLPDIICQSQWATSAHVITDIYHVHFRHSNKKFPNLKTTAQLMITVIMEDHFNVSIIFPNVSVMHPKLVVLTMELFSH